jgi:SAM-dependent methyltransferase
MGGHERREERSGPAAQAAEWDARYSEPDGARWSGRLNGRLVAEVATLKPGLALDVGYGEGADAIWLARRGWTVTAIDISDVAVSRAREAAERAVAAVEWVRGDALQTPFAARSFDLMSMQYPAPLNRGPDQCPGHGAVRLGGRNESDRPGARSGPGQAPVLKQFNKEPR